VERAWQPDKRHVMVHSAAGGTERRVKDHAVDTGYLDTCDVMTVQVN